MTSAAGARAINCTSCGAGQDVLGGGRVRVQVCEFCGAAMDASANFEVLATFSKAQDLGSPFVPGMQGKIDDIDWTVIGTLERTENWGGETWTWYEHQLYSESHGYAWLSIEEGHLVFSRRMRGVTDPRFFTSKQVERADHRPTARVMDDWIAYGTLDTPLAKRLFKYHESGTYRTRRAAGAFTWLPNVGEKDRSVTFTRDTEALTFTEAPNGEREVTLSRYLPQLETYESFGVAEADWAERGDHVLEPYRKGKHEGFVRRVVGACALVSLLLGLFLLFAPKERLFFSTSVIRLADLPTTVQFNAPGDGRLVELRVTSYPTNGWVGYDIDIEDPNGVPLGYHGVGIERYSGYDSEGSWTEGNTRATAVLRPNEPGLHTAYIDFAGFEPWRAGASPKPPEGIQVEVRAKRGAARWPLMAGVLFSVMFLVGGFSKMAHANKRSGLSDWVDEEDDD